MTDFSEGYSNIFVSIKNNIIFNAKIELGNKQRSHLFNNRTYLLKEAAARRCSVKKVFL